MANNARKNLPFHKDMNPTWKATFLGLIFILCGFTILAFALPLKTAFLFGDDEGFEVIKPMLCNQGYSLYKDIWNDQPPLYTVILAKAFKLFGVSIFTARCVTVLFALLLLVAFYMLVRSYSGVTTAVISCFLLITAPPFLVLSVSAMLELPSFALGLAALWFMRIWSFSRRSIWLLLSGAVMALACSTKLTAAILAPAVLLLPWFSSKALAQDTRLLFKSTALWAVSFLVVASLIGVIWGQGSWESSWRSHTTAQAVDHLKRPSDLQFNVSLLGDHAESIIAAGVSVVIALRYRRIREILISCVVLITVTGVHIFHRPWWNYYYIHFAIPIAWMAGWAVTFLLHRLMYLCSEKKVKWCLVTISQAAGLCLLLALPMARAERRLEGYFKDLKTRQTIAQNPIVAAIRGKSPTAKWIYSESGLYPFHANLPVDPHLAIIMPKRFWSGQISNNEIADTLKKNKAEMIVLPIESITAQWLIKHQYIFITNDGNYKLYQLISSVESSVSN